jgi:hypothetical protein
MTGIKEQLKSSDTTGLVRRGRPTSRFTAVSNALIEDRALSPEARVVLIYLLSKPEDWRLQIEDLRRVLGTGERLCGRDKTYAKVNELKAAGYVRVEPDLVQGRFNGLIYYVFDQPELDGAEPGREPPTQTSQDSSGESHCAANGAFADDPQHDDVPAPPFPENPDTVKPDPETPDSVNPHLTKDGKKQKTDLPPDPPKSPRRSGAKPEPPDRMAFDRFWEAWPQAERPRNRDLVEQLFNTLTPTERNHASIYAGAYRAQGAKHGQPAHMIPYLKARLFTEFIGAPPIEDGYFVITPDRQEWAPWLGHLKARHSEQIIAEQAAKGILEHDAIKRNHLIVESRSIFKSLEHVLCENRFPLFATCSKNADPLAARELRSM